MNLSDKENTSENFIQKNDTYGKNILYQLTPNSNKLLEIVKIKKEIRLWMLIGPFYGINTLKTECRNKMNNF